jgi:hypothetical protein
MCKAREVVLNELRLRNPHVQLNYLDGQRPSDLFVTTNSGNEVLIAVRSQQKGEWPPVKNILGKDRRVQQSCKYIVLVDFEGKSLNDRPDCYVLTIDEWRAVVRLWVNRRRSQNMQSDTTDPDSPDWPTQMRQDGDIQYGIIVKPEFVKRYRDEWCKILNFLGLKEMAVARQAL